jgi:hypothetical protein
MVVVEERSLAVAFCCSLGIDMCNRKLVEVQSLGSLRTTPRSQCQLRKMNQR